MKGLRLAAALAAVLMLANCAQPMRGLKVGLGILDASFHLSGYVCERAEKVYDDGGVFWGVRFVAAAIGSTCAEGGREVNVAAALDGEVRQALALEVGQKVDIDGDLAERTMTPARQSLLAAPASPSDLNEPIYATALRPGRR